MIKSNDIAMIILVASIALVVSFLVGNSLINSPENRQAEIEQIVPISADFPVPDDRIFKEGAINPTELIQIGEGNTEQPFEAE